MKRTLLLSMMALATAGCGLGTEAELAGTGQDALLRDDLAPRPERLALQRGEWCQDDVLTPQVAATIRDLPPLRQREVMDIGPYVQSSYLNTNGENEEVRRGVAEFRVEGDVRKALLRFKEARTVWPYPAPADTHVVSAYPADFKATVSDYDDPATSTARFETDVNTLPVDLVRADVTRAVWANQPAVGFRFQLEQLPGTGTEFDNLELVVTRCRAAAREL